MGETSEEYKNWLDGLDKADLLEEYAAAVDRKENLYDSYLFCRGDIEERFINREPQYRYTYLKDFAMEAARYCQDEAQNITDYDYDPYGMHRDRLGEKAEELMQKTETELKDEILAMYMEKPDGKHTASQISDAGREMLVAVSDMGFDILCDVFHIYMTYEDWGKWRKESDMVGRLLNYEDRVNERHLQFIFGEIKEYLKKLIELS